MDTPGLRDAHFPIISCVPRSGPRAPGWDLGGTQTSHLLRAPHHRWGRWDCHRATRASLMFQKAQFLIYQVSTSYLVAQYNDFLLASDLAAPLLTKSEQYLTHLRQSI